LFPLFVTGVIYTGGNFAAGVVDTLGRLPPVSTMLAKIVEKFAAGVVDTIDTTGINDTGGKIAAGINNTGSNFATSVLDTSGAP
jgi:hypothetical protein